jgi:hypothetical protein
MVPGQLHKLERDGGADLEDQQVALRLSKALRISETIWREAVLGIVEKTGAE